MEREQAVRTRITKVWAHNFRSLQDMELELSPLTVLVGRNASGKSTIVDVLRFVAEALRSGLDAAITARQGIVAMRRWSSKGRPFDVEVKLTASHGPIEFEYGFILGSKPHGQYEVKKEQGTIRFGDGKHEPWDFEVSEGKLTRPKVTKETRSLGDLSPGTAELALPTIRPLFPWELGRIGPGTSLRPRNWLSHFHGHLLKMTFYHIFPNVLREPQKPGTPYPLGEHGENLASVLRDMMKRDGLFFADLRDALGRVVPGVQDVQVSQVGGYLVVKLKHSVGHGNGQGAWFNLSQESDGTLRLLGLLVALFQDPAPALISMEEPELTVHPGALAALADLLKEATQRTQILMTTHSPELIDHCPIESLRAVESVEGTTRVGMVAEHQMEAVRKGLFSPGDLHRLEGLARRSTR